MNEQWRGVDAEAHEAKAEALSFAVGVLDGVLPILDAIEQPLVRNTRALLERAQKRHNDAAKLGRAA